MFVLYILTKENSPRLWLKPNSLDVIWCKMILNSCFHSFALLRQMSEREHLQYLQSGALRLLWSNDFGDSLMSPCLRF